MRFPCSIILLLSLAGCTRIVPAADESMVADESIVAGESMVPHDVLLSHLGIHSEGPKTYTLYQIRNQRGLPTGYTMVVDSVICLEGTCQTTNVTMFWDALGRYQRYELPEGEVLEKGVVVGEIKTSTGKTTTWKAAPFTDADHGKLDHILKNALSLLGQQTLISISGVRDNDEVDAVSRATPIALKDAVVEGASLTCFHLWHWANGDIVEVAAELTHQSCNEDLLRIFLGSKEPHYVLFALDHLKRHKLFSPSIVEEVNKVMRDGDHDRIDLGLAYLQEAMPDKDQFYDNLAALFNESNRKGRTYLLGLLASENELPAALFDKMIAAIPSLKTYYELHLFLRLVEKHEYVSQPLLTQTSQLLESDDFFIARRAYWYLEKQTVDNQIKKRIQVFREKSRKDGRIL